jgi:hypothetical protein
MKRLVIIVGGDSDTIRRLCTALGAEYVCQSKGASRFEALIKAKLLAMEPTNPANPVIVARVLTSSAAESLQAAVECLDNSVEIVCSALKAGPRVYKSY